MKSIKHHARDLTNLASLIAEERELQAAGLERLLATSDTDLLPLTMRNAVWIASGLTALEPTGNEICAALAAVAAQSAGLFRLMVEMPGEYPIPLGDGRRAILHNIGVTSHTNVGAWHTGFYAACIVRDEAALDQLARTPVAELRRSSTTADDCMYLWVEALQSWHLQQAGTADKLKAAVEATDPARLRISDQKYILDILVPPMELLFHLVTGDAAAFNTALQFAFERHKKYWGSAKHKTDPEGLFAFGPAAIASLAHDAGLVIEVESDYLPRRLFEGACRVDSSPGGA